ILACLATAVGYQHKGFRVVLRLHRIGAGGQLAAGAPGFEEGRRFLPHPDAPLTDFLRAVRGQAQPVAMAGARGGVAPPPRAGRASTDRWVAWPRSHGEL